MVRFISGVFNRGRSCFVYFDMYNRRNKKRLRNIRARSNSALLILIVSLMIVAAQIRPYKDVSYLSFTRSVVGILNSSCIVILHFAYLILDRK